MKEISLSLLATRWPFYYRDTWPTRFGRSMKVWVSIMLRFGFDTQTNPAIIIIIIVGKRRQNLLIAIIGKSTAAAAKRPALLSEITVFKSLPSQFSPFSKDIELGWEGNSLVNKLPVVWAIYLRYLSMYCVLCAMFAKSEATPALIFRRFIFFALRLLSSRKTQFSILFSVLPL